MKRLLILTVVATLAAGTFGCETTHSWCKFGGCGRNKQCEPACMPAPACNTCAPGGMYDNSYLAPPSLDMVPGPIAQ
jgi:hypothetical protein